MCIVYLDSHLGYFQVVSSRGMCMSTGENIIIQCLKVGLGRKRPCYNFHQYDTFYGPIDLNYGGPYYYEQKMQKTPVIASLKR